MYPHFTFVCVDACVRWCLWRIKNFVSCDPQNIFFLLSLHIFSSFFTHSSVFTDGVESNVVKVRQSHFSECVKWWMELRVTKVKCLNHSTTFSLSSLTMAYNSHFVAKLKQVSHSWAPHFYPAHWFNASHTMQTRFSVDKIY